MIYRISIFLTAVLFITNSASSQAQLAIEKLSGTSVKNQLEKYDNFIHNSDIEDIKGWKAYGRHLEFMRERLNPDGEPADASIFIKEAKKIASEKAQAARLKTGQAWSPAGPFGMPGTYSSSPSYGMGRINCITFHPSDPNTYWIGVAQGGVWKTTDGGESYAPLTDNLPIMRVSDIAVDRTNPDVIYLSVCDYAYIGVAMDTDERKRHSHYGLGVYKTTNGGMTWEPTGLSFEQSELDVSLIRRVLISPDDPGVLIAAGVSGIYKSRDAGDTWEQLRDDMIWDIEQDFTNPNTIYAASGYMFTRDLGQAGLFKSDDFGENWTQLDPGFPGDKSVSRVEIGLTPETPDYIYLVAANTQGGFHSFYRSTNSGLSWETMKHHSDGQNILYWYESAGGSNGQGWYDLAIQVDPVNKERVFVGGINMWGSEDGGKNWTMSSYWIMNNGFTLHADHHQYKFNPLDGMFYACHDGGVARTGQITLGRDGTGKWNTDWEERSNGMAITSFYRIGISEKYTDMVIGGAQDNSTFFKNDEGIWVNINGGDGMEAIIHPDDPDIIFASSQYGSWRKSTNGGRSFSNTRPNTNESGGWTTPMIMNKSNPNEMYCGYGNVYRSTNLGISWEKISNFPVVEGYNKPAIISALAMCPTNTDYLYAAKRPHYPYDEPSSMWGTTDGSHWFDITTGLPESLYFSYITVDDDDPSSVWVSCSGFLDGHKVYHSSDAGQIWENISYNLPNIPANTIVHHNGSDENIIYVGTDAGVYYTWDGHDQWELYSTDLPNVIVSELEIQYSTNKIIAATFGRGIWKAELAEATSSVNQIENQNLFKVYPNPAKESFEIEFSGIPGGELKIDLVDILGKVVYEENSQQSSGQGNIRINPDVKPGVYFVRLHAGGKMRSARVIIE